MRRILFAAALALAACGPTTQPEPPAPPALTATLEPGGTTDSITVEAETPVIDTQQVKNVQTITKEVIDQLPLGRDPILGPTQLAPGVVERTSSGSRRNETNYLVDGANQNAPNQGYAEASISWDAVEEIEFITTSNPMENYGAIGGTLNLVTRTGSNKFQGMASYYFTNRDLSQVLLPLEHSNTLRIGHPDGTAGFQQKRRDFCAMVRIGAKEDRLSPDGRLQQIMPAYGNQGAADKRHRRLMIGPCQFTSCI